MKNKRKKGFLFGICFLLFFGLSVFEAKAGEPVVSIVQEDGVSLLIKEGELYYTNAPVRFLLHAEPEEEAICEYALSGDDGANYSDWILMDARGYTLLPDFKNEAEGIWQIKFRKTVTIREDGVSQNKMEQESQKTEITESRVYRIGFDMCPPECSVTSEQELGVWSAKDIKCILSGAEDKSGIRSMLAETDGEILYAKEFSQSEAVRELETELILNKEARHADGIPLNITITDYAGNIQTLSKLYYIDKTRPSVQLSGIETGAIQKESVTVRAEADDNHTAEVKLIYQAIRTENAEQKFLEQQSLNGALERSYQEDGSYKILCYAVDPAGNRSDELEVVFRIDATPPLIQIGGVLGGTDYREGRSVSVSVAEAFFEDCHVNISAKRCTPGQEEMLSLPVWKSQGKNSENRYYFEADGDYLVSVKAEDAAGNEGSKEVYFRVDGNAPTLFIQGLSKKEVTNQPPKLFFYVEELFYDTAKVQCLLIKKGKNGIYVPVDIPQWRIEAEKSEFPLEIKEEGSYVLRAVITDRAGNRTEEQLSFTLDYTPPIIGFLDSLHQKYVKKFRLPADFQAKLSDLTAVSYKAYLNTRNFLPEEEVRQDGKYILRVEAVDEAGNEAEKTIEFIVDKTAPRVVMSGVRRDGTVGKNEKITLRLYDDEDMFTSVLLNGVEQAVDEEGKQAVLSFQDYGDHKIMIKATDPAQNELTQVISLSCALAQRPFASYQTKERTVKQRELPVSGDVAEVPQVFVPAAAMAAASVLLLTGVGILLYKRVSPQNSVD